MERTAPSALALICSHGQERYYLLIHMVFLSWTKFVGANPGTMHHFFLMNIYPGKLPIRTLRNISLARSHTRNKYHLLMSLLIKCWLAQT